MKGRLSRRLDVCLVAYRFHPVYAGPAVRFKRYAPGLRERGVDLRVFSAELEGDVGDSEGNAELLTRTSVDGIPVQRVRLPRASSKRTLRAYHEALARHLEISGRLPDVVQLLTLTPWASLSYRKMRRMRIPLVYTATMMPTPGLAWYKRRFDRIPLRWVDRVVVSTGIMQRSMGGHRPGLHVDVIPNGVDLARFSPLVSEDGRRALRLKLGLDARAEVVLFVGGFLSRRKGIDVLAEAWIRVASVRPRARLVLVGPHINELRPQGPQSSFLASVQQALASAPGGLDRVEFTGRVTNVEDYMRAADLFVFPSRKEGMPNVVPEAFGCAIASVLTPFEGLPDEFGRAGEQYMLSRRSPEDLAEAIICLLESPERRAALGGSARRWVEEHLNVERSLDLYAELYRELSERARTRTG